MELNIRPANNVSPHEVDYEEMFKNMPITDDTTCGFWFIKGAFLQRFANKKAYAVIYGLISMMFAACFTYHNGTITSMEKRFKISSTIIGVIIAGIDISALSCTVIVNYYVGKGHRPRWISAASFCMVLSCILSGLPHLLFGPGRDALLNTVECGEHNFGNSSIKALPNNKTSINCPLLDNVISGEEEETNIISQIILFCAQFVAGISICIFFITGVCYMDDNVKRSRTPALISLTYILRMIGPAIGYALASFCVKIFVSPDLTPTLTDSNPHWLGAWWIGWFVLSIPITILSFLIGLFPKTLPRAAMRKAIINEKLQAGIMLTSDEIDPDRPASLKDLILTLKRLLSNTTMTLNNLASIFYLFGFIPYWTYLPKYIEIQFHQTAAFASIFTGIITFLSAAFGILLSGVVVTKYKPNARLLAAWNAFGGVVSVFGLIAYAFLSCPVGGDNIAISDGMQLCSSYCSCDYVDCTPICLEDGNITSVAACQTGWCNIATTSYKDKMFTFCSCDIPLQNEDTTFTPFEFGSVEIIGGNATPESCAEHCLPYFYIFIAVVSFIKFLGASGRSTNFLVSVRCVDDKDKQVAFALSSMAIGLFAFIPAPIIAGQIMDKTCIDWGESGTGNCWLYDTDAMRFSLNFTSAGLVAIGSIFDIAVWYCVKDLKIFDEDEENERKRCEKELERKQRVEKDI